MSCSRCCSGAENRGAVPLTVAALEQREVLQLFGPVSPSPASFGVTPSLVESIPRPPLPEMLLPRMALRADVAARTTTPVPLFWMTFPSPAAVPPIVLPDVSSTRRP